MAIAAHGAAGGGLPDSTGVMLVLGLSLVAAAVGSCVPTVHPSRIGLLALLSGAQLAGHEALTITGHAHGVASAGMLGAHAAAVLGCALLIAMAEQIGPRCAAALRRALPRVAPLVPAAPVRPVAAQCVGPVTQRTAVLAVSLSRRGPPLTV